MPDIDESTAQVEKHLAEQRVSAAEDGAERTRQAVGFFGGFVKTAKTLHEANDYTNRMLLIMRGSNRAT
jgi:hypothetical protein